MSVTKKIIKKVSSLSEIEQLIEEHPKFKITKDDRFETINDEYRYINLVHYMPNIENGDDTKIAAVIKIPKVPENEDLCNQSYIVFNHLKNRENLGRLISNEESALNGPFKFGKKKPIFGVLSHLADCDLSYVINTKPNRLNIENSDKVDEEYVLDTFSQLAKGLHEMHKESFIHRDLKTSQFFQYTGDWVVADFGLVSKYDKTNKCTSSKKADSQFWSPHFLDHFNKTHNKEYKYSIQEDIFAFGVCLYQTLLKNNSVGMYTKFVDSKDKNYQQFIYDEIERMEVKEDTKYFLTRLLGEFAPADMDENNENYQYTSLKFFIDELENGKTARKFKKDDPKVKEFLNLHSDFQSFLNSIEKYRSGLYNTISLEAVHYLSEAHENYKHFANDENISLMGNTNDLKSQIAEMYNKIELKEKALLREVIENKIEQNDDELKRKKSIRDVLDFYKLIYVWGNNMRKDSDSDKKSGYSLKEVNDEKTFFKKILQPRLYNHIKEHLK